MYPVSSRSTYRGVSKGSGYWVGIGLLKTLVSPLIYHYRRIPVDTRDMRLYEPSGTWSNTLIVDYLTQDLKV